MMRPPFFDQITPRPLARIVMKSCTLVTMVAKEALSVYGDLDEE